MPKRAQTATEFMITYFWAVVIVIMAAAILWKMGAFNPQMFQGGGSCGGFASFTCVDQYAGTAGGNFSLVLGNSRSTGINLISAAIAGGGAPTGTCIAGNFQGGSGVPVDGKLRITCAGSPLQRGDSYEWSVSITYADSVSGLIRTDSGGFVKGKAG